MEPSITNFTDKDMENIKNHARKVFRQYRQVRKLTGNSEGLIKIAFSPSNETYIVEMSMSEVVDYVNVHHVESHPVTKQYFEKDALAIVERLYKNFLDTYIAKYTAALTPATVPEISLYNKDGLEIILHYHRHQKDYQALGKKWKNCVGTRFQAYQHNYIIEVLHNGYKIGITEVCPHSDLDNSFDFCRRFINNMNGVLNEPVTRTAWMRKTENAEMFNQKMFEALLVVYTESKRYYQPTTLRLFSDGSVNPLNPLEGLNRLYQVVYGTNLGDGSGVNPVVREFNFPPIEQVQEMSFAERLRRASGF